MASYGQFCPVSRAADVLCTRWAVLVMREVLAGATRFGELQRGLPGCPPATLTKRLKELEAAGVLVRRTSADGISYEPTEAGLELYPIVEAMGRWGQRWARSTYEAHELDADSLLWGIRPFLDPDGLGAAPAVVQLTLAADDGPPRWFWLVVDRGEVDVCKVDPERPVDVVVEAHLRTITRVWMGDDNFAACVERGDIVLRGPRSLCRRIPAWFGQHPVLASVGPALSA